MTIRVDTREQLAYTFERVRAQVPFETRRMTLRTGDYAVLRPDAAALHTATAVVERKSLADLYNSVAHDRERFVAKLMRMQSYGYSALVVEAEWSEILNPNAHLAHATKMRPKAMFATLLAWSQRYQVHLFPCPGRAAAELFTFRILERWFRDGAPTA